MHRSILLAVAALVWFAVSVCEARNRTLNNVWLPPAKYDHPYPLDKLLVVERYETEQEVMLAGCEKGQPWDTWIACADGRTGPFSMVTGDFVPGCTIHMVSDKVLRKYDLDPELVMRHEIGHCNGWGPNHEGHRLYRDLR